jgi:hypothetical protein
VDIGKLSNKETEKAVGQLVGWSVYFLLSSIAIQSEAKDLGKR